MYLTAKRCQIHQRVLSRIVAEVFVESAPGGNRRRRNENIGLELKSTSRQQIVLHYCEKSDDGGWMFTDRAIALINEYKRRFPTVFDAISKHGNARALPRSALLTDQQRTAIHAGKLKLEVGLSFLSSFFLSSTMNFVVN